tara:strand:- start:460 stop:978 length:519 start_codon:yes stop_codon:yes gene_type:complete
MDFSKTKIPDVLLFTPTIFSDNRGNFHESFNLRYFNDATGFPVEFVQDNESHSKKGVLRGLHYQKEPMAQGKLVRVVAGEVFDVAVDIRKNSKTFGQWVGVKLSDKNKKQLWIPTGFAHGFLTLSEYAIFSYKVTNYYSKEHEISIHYENNQFSIEWPEVPQIILSEKDGNT